MTGVGLEPTTNGLTYPIGFHRPPVSHRRRWTAGVESLDYPTAIAGVPRLVSEAGTGAPPPPCLLMTQSPVFSTVTLAVTGRVVVSEALRAFQHTAAFTLRGSVSSRGRLQCATLKSVALPTELPGQNFPNIRFPPPRRLAQVRND